MPDSIVLKLITSGEGGVGKTTLLHRYVQGEFFPNTKMTLGVDFIVKELNVNGVEVMLQLWDFGGQVQFRHLLKNYVVGARGALFLFDLTRMSTIDRIDEWINILRYEDPELPIILLGSKWDLSNNIMINDDLALEIKNQFNFLEYLKVSSLDGRNVEEAFKILTLKIIKNS